MINKVMSLRLRFLRKRSRFHPKRLSRDSIRYAAFLSGAAFVALVSLGFAELAELSLSWNASFVHAYPWAAFLLLPFGFAVLRWLTLRYANQARGSGIPQIIAGMSLPSGSPAQTVLVSLPQAMWKIVLTAGGLLAGASIGREGPSVQVGAAVMCAWGRWCNKHIRLGAAFRSQSLIAAGAAGGLAAAFNTPLAGIVFAIEELGRGKSVHWDRVALSGVLTAGFLSLALFGNYSYFPMGELNLSFDSVWQAVVLCAVVSGIVGGLFAKTLTCGLPGVLPHRFRRLPARHPIYTAFACGLAVALLGWLANGTTYGTGYEQAAAMLNGESGESLWFGVAKWCTTVLSYFAGIPGGIFTPSLSIGAGIGDYMNLLFPEVGNPSLLVLICMAAFLAAATQSPITASVIVMEMTKGHNVMLYLLAATLIASGLSGLFTRRPFYHAVARSFRREAVSIEEAENRKSAGQPQ